MNFDAAMIQIAHLRQNAEYRLIDFLRSISFQRTKFLIRLQPYIFWLESSLAFHLTLVSTVIIIICSVFVKVKTVTFLSLHPVCMSIGTLIFIGEGIALFRNRFLIETLSPIMQKGKRSKSRTIHLSLQIIGTLFLVMGILFVWTSEVRIRHSIVPNSIHSFCGFATMILIGCQAIVGQRKLWDMELKSRGRQVAQWHGDAGLFLWDIICLTLLSGTLLFIDYSYLGFYFIVFALIASWIALHLQMKLKGPDTSTIHAFMMMNNSGSASASSVNMNNMDTSSENNPNPNAEQTIGLLNDRSEQQQQQQQQDEDGFSV